MSWKGPQDDEDLGQHDNCDDGTHSCKGSIASIHLCWGDEDDEDHDMKIL